MAHKHPVKDKQLATALLLSYPQMFVWAVVFALIGGATVWTSDALTANSRQSGSITLRLITDNNLDKQPNWGDSITFDAYTSATSSPVLKLNCYKSGQNVLSVQMSYAPGVQAAYSRYIELMSGQWTGGGADCAAALLNTKTSTDSILSTYTFHVNP
jgi:hypothetical protein